MFKKIFRILFEVVKQYTSILGFLQFIISLFWQKYTIANALYVLLALLFVSAICVIYKKEHIPDLEIFIKQKSEIARNKVYISEAKGSNVPVVVYLNNKSNISIKNLRLDLEISADIMYNSIWSENSNLRWKRPAGNISNLSVENYEIPPKKTNEIIGRFSFKKRSELGTIKINYEISSETLPAIGKSFKVKLV